ncbi:MAG: CHAT domain-containing protein [Alphaproteobacteria bacterium]|nr:CHAT domain-containing protein [Alphaproteobacteria bacterium]MBL7096522.1 CHAT domain-containing protein [Alphaproteobacteria bacterium]
MSAKRISSLLAAVALCAAGASAFAADPGGASLGQTLTGETCTLGGGKIACGADPAAGTLRVSTLSAVLPADATARRAAILAAAKALPEGLATARDVSCDPGQWVGNSANKILFLCTLRASNWPRVILVSADGSTLVAAEGLPSMLPVLDTAAQNALGLPPAPADVAAAEALVKAKYPAALSLGSGDFSSYKAQVEAARLYGGADNYAGAEDSYRKALAIEQKLFGDNSLAAGETLAELALQVSNQGRFDEAAALFNRAAPIIEGSPSNVARARLASYRALDAANQRKYDDALKFAREATAQRRAEVDAAKAASVADALNSGELTAPVALEGELAHSLRIEAEMALRLGDNASAQAAAEEALWIITEEPGLPLWWKPDMVSLMGEVNTAQGRVVVAERDFLDALALDQKLFGDTAPTARAELRVGQFYAEQQVYPAAVKSFRDAIAILAKDPVARTEVVSDQIVPFLAAASALGVQDPAQKAALDADMFRAMQLVNSGIADQTIARVAAREAAGDPALAKMVADLQAAETLRDNARLELVAENAKPNEERNGAAVAKYEADLKASQANVDALMANVAKAYPDYAKLADPGPVALADFQRQLAPGEAYVGFVVGAKSSFAVVVTPGALTSVPLTATSDGLAGDVAALRSAFVPKLGKLGDFSLKNSYALYQQLLRPTEPALAGVNHIIVAPGASLDSLPLALLVTSPSAGGYANADWLVKRMAVSQVPSPRAYVSLRAANHAEAPRPFFGVGNPAFTGDATSGKALSALAAACNSGGPVDPALLRALPPLPQTAAEVQAVGASFGAQPGSILLGAAATESAVRGANLGDYRVLYFATHGMLPGELHCQAEPGLVLTPGSGAASTATDGLLTASEIATLKLNADLVVLSACNTAASGGTRMGGGALEGLADSFFAAGARAVIASHWEVPSAATQKLMTGVFSRYAGSRDLAESLRQSQLALIANPATAHPFNWAAFTLIGDAGVTVARTASAR